MRHTCCRDIDTAGSAAAVAAQRRDAAQLEALLSGHLDPIDWATYEPYLYANKDRAVARSKVCRWCCPAAKEWYV